VYPDEFDYHAPETVDEAVELLAAEDEFDVELLAGGHSLLPTMKTGFASPNVVVDIGNVDELRGIESTDGSLTIGALTTYNEIVASDAVATDAPVVGKAAAEIGDEQVRNRGTIGGNVAHADPASDLPGAVMAAGAEIVARGPAGVQVYDADEFYAGMYETALGRDEIVTAVRIPRRSTESVGAYGKKPSPSSGYAMVGVAVGLEMDGSTVVDARVAANGVLDHAVRLSGVESRLRDGQLDEETVTAAAEHATDGLDVDRFLDDLQASGAFRANLLEVYTRRTLQELQPRRVA
jgi:carbon-monoxide dehydrogenase medium subunit